MHPFKDYKTREDRMKGLGKRGRDDSRLRLRDLLAFFALLLGAPALLALLAYVIGNL